MRPEYEPTGPGEANHVDAPDAPDASSVEQPPWPPDVSTRLGDYLRQMRRLADLSQRQLSDAAGVTNATVVRVEADPQSDVRVSTFSRLVTAAGFRLLICDDEDRPIAPQSDLHEIFRDLSGRRLPAHLDPQRVTDNAYRLWWQRPHGDFTFTRDRQFRDEVRARNRTWLERYLNDRDGTPPDD